MTDLPTSWECRDTNFSFKLPVIMGILNVTRDSFSDGGKYNDFDNAIDHAKKLIIDGADIIDIGGESTRPGAQSVSTQEEINRVIPVIEELCSQGILVSLDSSNPSVIDLAIQKGVSVINDIRALQNTKALELVAASNVGVCLMHMQGNPQTMQQQPQYSNVITEVINFLTQRISACHNKGIGGNRIMIDPGIGFGKSLEHNISLIKATNFLNEQTKEICAGVLMGVSRKSMFGLITGSEVDKRLPATLGCELFCILQNAKVIRTHEPKALADIYKIWNILQT